jgi:hypothetical protein
MNITIEEINGKPHTVITPPGIEAAKEGEAELENWRNYCVTGLLGETICIGESIFDDGLITRGVCAVFLPPLPRRPTVKDASLLHLYAAHGLYASSEDINTEYQRSPDGGINSLIYFGQEITHATHNGERVEVAII